VLFSCPKSAKFDNFAACLILLLECAVFAIGMNRSFTNINPEKISEAVLQNKIRDVNARAIEVVKCG
jgi:hypothetical protein